MYYIVFCVLAILLISAIVGLRRGLFKTLFGLLSLVLSIVAAYFINPYVSSYIINNTEIYLEIESRISEKIEEKVESQIQQSLEDAGVTTDLEDITSAETEKALTESPDKSTQIQMIDAMNLPNSVKTSFIENNNDDIYSSLNITGFYDYLAKYAARMVVNMLCYVVIFVLIRLVLLLISLIITSAMDGDAVLSGFNRFAGMLLGLGVGFIIIWIFMIIAGFAFGSAYDSMIEENQLLQMINDNNLLLRLIMSL